MGSTEDHKKCSIKSCKKMKATYKGAIWSSFCTAHKCKATINSFLAKTYKDMKARVTGTKKGAVADRSSHIYIGKPILPRDIFMSWAKNHPDFLKLYKQYATSNFDRRLAPSINRINSKKGYTLDNMEWMTTSQNCGLSGEVKRMKNRKAIYDLLGVNE